MKPTLILADDHPLLMQGAVQHLNQHGYHILHTSDNGNDAYLSILEHSPDIAILDMDMPILTGLEVAKKVKVNNVKTKIVILTLYKQEAILVEVGQSIEGYVTKDSALEELDNCLQKVHIGELYISPKLKGNIIFDNKIPNLELLTPTEIKILKMLKQNLTSADVADQLFVSKRTVEKHRSNIIQKLDLGSGHNALFMWLNKHGDKLN